MRSPLQRGFDDALELRPDEVVRWSSPAMHHVGRTWVGGRLYVSDQRLIFCPGLLVRRRHGILRLELAGIRRVELLDRRIAVASLAGGALKPRIEVTDTAGDKHAFTTQRFAERAAELEGLLNGSGSGAGMPAEE